MTKLMHFYSKTAPMHKTSVKLRERSIPHTATAKFLRLNWDSKLNWKNHISKLKAKCAKNLNLLKSITALKWGAGQETLMRLYRAIIRPKIDYGFIVYGAAMEAELNQVDSIANEAFRISTGAFKSTPTANLQVLVNEPPLVFTKARLAIAIFFQTQVSPPKSSLFINNQHKIRGFFRSRNYVTVPIIMRLRQAIQR